MNRLRYEKEGSTMKLKETTLDQRLFAGLISVIVFIYGFLLIGEIEGKYEQICRVPGADNLGMTAMGFYVVLATIGAGLGTLHLLAMMKFRK
jgi:hypothetical protein